MTNLAEVERVLSKNTTVFQANVAGPHLRGVGFRPVAGTAPTIFGLSCTLLQPQEYFLQPGVFPFRGNHGRESVG